jgi:hypothetical protein
MEKYYSLMPWDSFQKEFRDKFQFNFNSIDYVLDQLSQKNIFIKWNNLDNWEDIDDLEIFYCLKKIKNPEGQLIIITESSYKKKLGPFKINASDIEFFISNHLTEFSECFFNGDAQIISFEHKSMWLFHHEGQYTFIETKGML